MSPNILRTVRRTIIRFLTQLLVRPTWFAQFDELYFVLAYNEMQASARTCGRSEVDSMIQKCRLKSSQYTLIISHRVIQLTTISFWVPETRLRLPQVNKQVNFLRSEWSIHTVIHFYFYFFLIYRRALFALNQSEAMFAELGECSQKMLSEDFRTPNIASSQFDEYLELGSRSKSSSS